MTPRVPGSCPSHIYGKTGDVREVERLGVNFRTRPSVLNLWGEGPSTETGGRRVLDVPSPRPKRKEETGVSWKNFHSRVLD